MMGVTPYIAFPGTCRQAMELYVEALGAEVLFSQTYEESPMAGMGAADAIMHATIRVGSSTIMMCDAPQANAPAGGGNVSLTLGCDDAARAQEVFAGLAVGGTVTMPLEKTFWAEAFGMLVDQFGVQWMINCDVPR